MQELLKNAAAACERIKDGDRSISIDSTVRNNWLSVEIKNNYRDAVIMSDGLPDMENSSLESYKGLGMRYVKEIVENNGGVFFCEARKAEKIFYVKLMFPY